MEKTVMTTGFWAAAAACTAVGILMSLLGHKVVHTEIVIPAPPKAVWAVLTAPASYAEWNPIFIHVEGLYREGAEMRYRMRDNNGKVSDVTSKVVKLIEPRVLNQFGGIRGVLTFDHTWQLEPVDGGTRLIQHEEYRGFGVWFWDASWVEPIYQRANEALRKRVIGARSGQLPAGSGPP